MQHLRYTIVPPVWHWIWPSISRLAAMSPRPTLPCPACYLHAICLVASPNHPSLSATHSRILPPPTLSSPQFVSHPPRPWMALWKLLIPHPHAQPRPSFSILPNGAGMTFPSINGSLPRHEKLAMQTALSPSPSSDLSPNWTPKV